MPMSLPELDLAPFMAAPHSAARPRARRAVARRVSRTGVLLSRRATACRPSSMPRSWPSRASSSRCRKPSGARSPSRARRTSAATRCSATSARKAPATGASSSTSAPRSRPPSSRAGDPPWRRLRGPNQWPARLPAMQPTVLAWMRAMDRVGLAVLRALALGLGQPLRPLRRRRAAARRSAPEDHPLPCAAARRRHGPRRRHASRLGARVVRAARRRRRIAGRARRRARRRDAEARHLRHESWARCCKPRRTATCARRSIACKARRRGASDCPSRTSSIRGSMPCSRRSSCRPSSPPPRAAAQNADPNDPIFATFGDNYLKIRLRSHRDVALAHYADLESA